MDQLFQGFRQPPYFSVQKSRGIVSFTLVPMPLGNCIMMHDLGSVHNVLNLLFAYEVLAWQERTSECVEDLLYVIDDLFLAKLGLRVRDHRRRPE